MRLVFQSESWDSNLWRMALTKGARNLPVMVVTSRAGAKHRERAMKEGASTFLTKPVQEDQFITAVTKLIGPGADRVTAKALAAVAPA